MKKYIFILVLTLIGSLVITYGITQKLRSTRMTPTTSNIATQVPTEQFFPSTIDTNELKIGGSSYSDPSGVFTLLYPSDYRLDTSDPLHPRIVKIGATQRGQTEIYDGVLIVFETIDLSQMTLEQFVDQRIQEIKDNGAGQLLIPKKAIAFGSYPGFTYESRGLGVFTDLFIEKETGAKKGLRITYMVADPQNQNYQNQVYAALATVQLHQ